MERLFGTQSAIARAKTWSDLKLPTRCIRVWSMHSNREQEKLLTRNLDYEKFRQQAKPARLTISPMHFSPDMIQILPALFGWVLTNRRRFIAARLGASSPCRCGSIP